MQRGTSARGTRIHGSAKDGADGRHGMRTRLYTENGSGSVLAIAVIGALLALVCTLLPLLAGFVASQSVGGAADAAALAAADVASGLIPGVPCVMAQRAAELSGAHLDSCDLDGVVATVRVSRTVAGMLAQARARAGPPGADVLG